jgi:hypothetical protein
MMSRVLNASIHPSMRARVAADGGYSALFVLAAMYRAIALLSKMHTPSAVSSSGTLPKGFLARNSGVLFVTPIVNGGCSSCTPLQPATALTRLERPVGP